MRKVEKYERPDVRLIYLTSEGIMCMSFTGSTGGEDDDNGGLPGYNEELFPW